MPGGQQLLRRLLLLHLSCSRKRLLFRLPRTLCSLWTVLVSTQNSSGCQCRDFTCKAKPLSVRSYVGAESSPLSVISGGSDEGFEISGLQYTNEPVPAWGMLPTAIARGWDSAGARQLAQPCPAPSSVRQAPASIFLILYINQIGL